MKDNLCMNGLVNFHNERNEKRQRQVAHLYAAGPRPVLEAFLAIDAGGDIDTVLTDFARVAVSTYHMLGANELPIDRVVQ